MRLDVPLAFQGAGTHDCALAGISMILKYYGIEKSIEDIKLELHDDGTFYYMPQIGSYLIRLGYDVSIITMNPGLFNAKDKGMKHNDIMKRLETLKQHSKTTQNTKILDYFVSFIDNGGKIVVKIPDENDISGELNAGRPLGAALTTNFMYPETDKVNFNSHFQIVTGMDDKYVYVNDPLPNQDGGKQAFPINQFFYGLYASAYGDLDNASLILIKPKDL